MINRGDIKKEFMSFSVFIQNRVKMYYNIKLPLDFTSKLEPICTR